MKRALIIGIDHYPVAPLSGCVNDAKRLTEILASHQNGDPNFECETIVSGKRKITRALLREKLQELFEHWAEVALFYFAGHGVVNEFGGYLVTQDFKENDEGVAMLDVLSLANQSEVKEVVIILDCCHAGAAGVIPALQSDQVLLREGVSILTATSTKQKAIEEEGGGIFTTLLCGALESGAADVQGNVTIASVYAYLDQALGAWQQRPYLKTHVSRLITLRECEPALDLAIIRQLPTHFPVADFEFPLDPSFEPTSEQALARNTDIFAELQACRGAQLVEPIGEEHMYYAAMNSQSCRLTPLGQFYWKLAKGRKI